MADEKKIQEAADNYIGHAPEIDEGVYVASERNAFKNGIKWFKENLWHSTKEEPQQGEPIITKWWDEVDGASYETDNTGCVNNWKEYCSRNNIMAWCYLSDILP